MNGKDPQVLLSIGSNMGDKQKNIESAVIALCSTEGISDVSLSGLYETEPVGYEDQDMFYNICVLCRTTLSPEKLLDRIHEIEADLHRERIIRWGPRTIDIDIILYGDITMDTEDLTIPHPRYKERAFVLKPMKDLMDYGGEIPDEKEVRQIPWEFGSV